MGTGKSRRPPQTLVKFDGPDDAEITPESLTGDDETPAFWKTPTTAKETPTMSIGPRTRHRPKKRT